MNIFQVFLKRWLLVCSLTIIATLAVAGYLLTRERVYEAVASIFARPTLSLPGPLGDLAKAVGGDSSSPKEDYIKALLDSAEVRVAVFDKLKLEDNKVFWEGIKKHTKVAMLRRLEDFISVLAKQGVIYIRARTTDPELSAKLANTFLNEGAARLKTRSNRVGVVFDSKISEAKGRLEKAELALKAFQGDNSTVAVPEELAKVEFQAYNELATELAKAQVEKKGYEEMLNSSGNLTVQVEMKGKYAAASAKASTLQGIVDVREDHLKKQPNLAVTRARLVREVLRQEKLLQMAIEQRETMLLQHDAKEDDYTVLDKAFVPDEPMPRKALVKIIAAFITCFTLSLALASALEPEPKA